MKDLSLHVLDIAENSVRAGAKNIRIVIHESSADDRFELRVEDDGCGIDPGKMDDMYFTSKCGKKFGMGLPLLRQSAQECAGSFAIEAAQPHGTIVRAEFQRSHLDMKPLGNFGATVEALLCACEETDYVVDYACDGRSFVFETAHLREELDGLPLTEPTVLQYIKQEIHEGIRRAHG